MVTLEEAYRYVKENLTDKRFIHTLGVISVAKKLGNINGIPEEKVEIAALCHDIAKYTSKEDAIKLFQENDVQLTESEINNPELWHSILGPIIAKNELAIEDDDILNAIRWHTTGRENMSTLEKIIYISDMIEPSRVFNEVEKIREVTLENLDKGVILGLDCTIKFLLSKGVPIDINTVKARNYLILSLGQCR